jgi:hypothetical protein
MGTCLHYPPLSRPLKFIARVIYAVILILLLINICKMFLVKLFKLYVMVNSNVIYH